MTSESDLRVMNHLSRGTWGESGGQRTAIVNPFPRVLTVPSASGRLILYSPSDIFLADMMKRTLHQQDVQPRVPKKGKRKGVNLRE